MFRVILSGDVGKSNITLKTRYSMTLYRKSKVDSLISIESLTWNLVNLVSHGNLSHCLISRLIHWQLTRCMCNLRTQTKAFTKHWASHNYTVQLWLWLWTMTLLSKKHTISIDGVGFLSILSSNRSTCLDPRRIEAWSRVLEPNHPTLHTVPL